MTTSTASTKDQSQNPTIKKLIEGAIELAIAEDLGVEGEGDLTSNATIKDDCQARAVVLLKESGMVAGLDIFELVMHRFSKAIEIEVLVKEGTFVAAKDIARAPKEILKLSGPAAKILQGERLALNLIQRMSGVATLTRKFVDKAKPHGIAILDTRKTTPCLRVFEKYAVLSAGGTNHRMGLFDNILIKENHIRVAGGITEAIEACRTKYPDKPVEVETTNLEEVQEALDNKAEKILLDNMTPEMVRKAIDKIQKQSKIEVSGGINLDNIDNYLIKGVDYISIGALTHSVKAIDYSLEILELSSSQ